MYIETPCCYKRKQDRPTAPSLSINLSTVFCVYTIYMCVYYYMCLIYPYLSMRLSIYLCLFNWYQCLSFCLSIDLCLSNLHLSLCVYSILSLSVYRSIFEFICLFIYLSIYLLSTYPCFYLSNHLSIATFSILFFIDIPGIILTEVIILLW